MLIRIMFAPWLMPYPRLMGVLKGINMAGLTTTHSAWNFSNSVLKTSYAHISGKAERDGRQAYTPSMAGSSNGILPLDFGGFNISEW